MKKVKVFKSSKLKKKLSVISAEAKSILSSRGARGAMIAAMAFFIASAGLALIASYLLLNVLEYVGVIMTDEMAATVSLGFILVFSVPAAASLKHISCVVCDGGEASLSELFIAFSSAERFFSAYFGAFIIGLRYGIAVLILYAPDLVGIMFDLDLLSDASPVSVLIVAADLLLIAMWLFFTSRLSRLWHCIWSKKLSVLKALASSLSGKHIIRPLSKEDLLNMLLSVVTCFTYFVYHAAPLWAVSSELFARREQRIINELLNEKSRKDGQKQ